MVETSSADEVSVEAADEVSSALSLPINLCAHSLNSFATTRAEGRSLKFCAQHFVINESMGAVFSESAGRSALFTTR